MRILSKSAAGTIVLLVCLVVTVSLSGCGPKVPTTPRVVAIPPVAFCHDAIGHIAGNKPWIMGGNCCCTPSEERFAGYQREGTVPADMTYPSFLQLFKDRGIITDLDADYRGCNCLDKEYGPHVVFGGRCMVTPTPGTRVYEDVTAGKHIEEK